MRHKAIRTTPELITKIFTGLHEGKSHKQIAAECELTVAALLGRIAQLVQPLGFFRCKS